MEVRKTQPFPSHAVQVWCPVELVAVCADVGITKIVGQNQDDVWFLTRWFGIVCVCGKGSQGKSSGGRGNNCSDIHCALPP